MTALRGVLLGFAQELARVRVLDPACGSGNFLYVALKQLLDLWKEVSTTAADLGLSLLMPTEDQAPSPEQLHGIEINEYAHELAQVTIWIGYIQWLRDNGFGRPSEPVLKPIDTIEHRDAILAFDEEGQPVEPEWPAVDVIVGNPPFLGDKKMRIELGDTYVEALRTLFADRVPGQADLVCYWFEKARSMLGAGRLQRAGLLATNSIRTGANRAVLDRVKDTGEIFMAWSDRSWVVEGAAVRVSMIGFDDGKEQSRILNGLHVDNISADLSSGTDVTIAKSLQENEGLATVGATKKGPFDIEASLAHRMLNATGNPNGRPNSDVVKPWVGATDIVRQSRGMYLIDFGVDMPISEAAQYELPFQHVQTHVYPLRSRVRSANERNYWWLLGRPSPKFRDGVRGMGTFIATPSVARHRIFAWLPENCVPSHGVVVFFRKDDYFFGVLQSKVHEVWSLKLGNWLGVGNDPAYKPTTCFETFPFPWPPGHEPDADPRVEAIAAAARELVEQRDRWLSPEGATEAELKKRTLTNLYNARPTWLDLAHKRLDAAVLDAYGWPHDISDEELLESLLELNLERAAHSGPSPAGP